MALQTTCSKSQANQSHHLGSGVDSLPLNRQAVTMVSEANLRVEFTCKPDAHTQASRAHYKLSLLSLIVRRLNVLTHSALTHNLSENPNRRELYVIASHEKLTQAVQGWFISPDLGPFCSLISSSCSQEGGLTSRFQAGREQRASSVLHTSQTYF